MMNLPRPFDAELWRAAEPSSDLRCSMVADLRHRIGLVGRTEAAVVRLLGGGRAKPGSTATVYRLCPTLADDYVLEIEWMNGRVAMTRISVT